MGSQVVRPVDIIGQLPDVAAEALARLPGLRAISKLGSCTVDALDAEEAQLVTIEPRHVQAAHELLSLVVFFSRLDVGPLTTFQPMHFLPLGSKMAYGFGTLLNKSVVAVGKYEDATHQRVRWILLPKDAKKWC